MIKIKDWFNDICFDIVVWAKDRPLRKTWRGIKDRFDAVLFCLMLLAVGFYSPKTLRKLMIDALTENRK